MRPIVCGLVLVVFAFSCWAETIVVDHTSIQTAIDDSWDGDTVLVRPGTYNECIKFNGRRITLTSLNPDDENIVKATIITVPDPDAGTRNNVTFDFGEDSDSVITGFTISVVAPNRGISCSSAAPTITKNRILSTYSTYQGSSGSGIYGSEGIISNNIIEGCSLGIQPIKGVIYNNTIVGNGSGIWFGDTPPQIVIIKNNIIANNKSYGLYCINGWGTSNNSYNCFWNNNSNYGDAATAGTGDFWRNPLFAIDGHWSGNTWVGGDYHLQSTAGRWTGTEWVLDAVNSPCIDKGDPSSSIGVEPNPNGGRINIGAYGGTSHASKSSSGVVQPVCINSLKGDLNDDCKVDFADFAIFAQSWLVCNLDPPSACWQ